MLAFVVHEISASDVGRLRKFDHIWFDGPVRITQISCVLIQLIQIVLKRGAPEYG